MVLTVGDLWQNKSEEEVWLQGGEREDRNRSIERRSIKNMKKAQKRADKSTHNASLIPHFVMLELYPKIDYIYFLLKFYTQSPKTMKWKKFAQNSCKLIQPYLQQPYLHTTKTCSNMTVWFPMLKLLSFAYKYYTFVCRYSFRDYLGSGLWKQLSTEISCSVI